MFRVWQANKRQLVFREVGGELIRIIGPDYQDGHVSLCELIMVLAQLRQMRAAERSDKSPVEDQEHMLFPVKVG